MDRPVSALEQLLHRVAPRAASAGVSGRVSLRRDGAELPIEVTGGDGTLLHAVRRGSSTFAFPSEALLVLHVVLDHGGVHVDLPVEVVSTASTSMSLRVLSSPLVLRRRSVRDLALAEAVGLGPAPGSSPLVA